MTLPDLATARPRPLAIVTALIFWQNWTVLRVLGACAAPGLIAGLAGLPGV